VTSTQVAWWRRLDGLPPSTTEWRAAAEERRLLIGRTNWRRWFVGGSLWLPVVGGALVVGQVVLDTASGDHELPDVAFRAGVIIVFVVSSIPVVLSRSAG
jgi:hypothetical protein